MVQELLHRMTQMGVPVVNFDVVEKLSSSTKTQFRKFRRRESLERSILAFFSVRKSQRLEFTFQQKQHHV